MHTFYAEVPMPTQKRDKHYSNDAPQSIGYGGNDKGRVNREREAQKNWSNKKILTTGLVDRERL